MDTPRTATDAVAALVDAQVIPPPDVAPDDLATAWTALGRHHTWSSDQRARYNAAEADHYRDTPVDLSAPPVLMTLPESHLPRSGWVYVTGDPSPADLGLVGEGVGRLSARVAESRRRRRLALVAGPTGESSPRGAVLLTAAVLGARVTAARLDTWSRSRSLAATSVRRAKAEAADARAYADLAEAALPGAFNGWLDDALAAAGPPVPAWPTVPAVMRGTARLGTT